jgi:hypothetical protein
MTMIRDLARKLALAAVTAAILAAAAATAGRASELDGAEKLVLYWDVPEDILALTQGGGVPIINYPEGIRSLAGTAAESQLMLGVTIRDDKREIVGIATELETFDQPMGERFSHDTVWTIMIPGRGTLVAFEREESTDEVLAFFRRIQAAGGAWEGDFEAPSTVGPASNGLGIIIGGTGEFEGATGYMLEENRFLAFDFNAKTSEVRNRLTFYITGRQ